jgi:hypothetical protein
MPIMLSYCSLSYDAPSTRTLREGEKDEDEVAKACEWECGMLVTLRNKEDHLVLCSGAPHTCQFCGDVHPQRDAGVSPL